MTEDIAQQNLEFEHQGQRLALLFSTVYSPVLFSLAYMY